MQKIILGIFILIFLSACSKQVEPPPPPPEAKDITRVESYNKLANLKEGIWRVEEWKAMAKKMCEDSKQIDCSTLAEIYHDYFYGYGSKSDIAKALGMLEKSCNANDSMSCLKLGIYNAHSKDFAKSTSAFAKAYELSLDKCGQDYAIDCQVLSLMYFEGYTPLTRDRAKAIDYANKSCDMKNANACIFLSINAENRQDYLDARKKACTLGVKEFCK